MAAGLQITNPWGTAIIDGTALPYRFKEKGVFSSSGTYFEPSTFTSSSLFAYRVDGYRVHERRNALIGGQRRIRVWTNAPGGTDVEWFRFEQEAHAPSTHGEGLEIYNSATGQCVYSTDDFPMIIRDAVYINAASHTGETRNVTSGRKYAFLFSNTIAKEGTAVFGGVNGKGEALYSIPTEAFFAQDMEDGTYDIIKGSSVNQPVRDQTWANGTRSGWVLALDVTAY